MVVLPLLGIYGAAGLYAICSPPKKYPIFSKIKNNSWIKFNVEKYLENVFNRLHRFAATFEKAQTFHNESFRESL